MRTLRWVLACILILGCKCALITGCSQSTKTESAVTTPTEQGTQVPQQSTIYVVPYNGPMGPSGPMSPTEIRDGPEELVSLDTSESSQPGKAKAKGGRFVQINYVWVDTSTDADAAGTATGQGSGAVEVVPSQTVTADVGISLWAQILAQLLGLQQAGGAGTGEGDASSTGAPQTGDPTLTPPAPATGPAP